MVRSILGGFLLENQSTLKRVAALMPVLHGDDAPRMLARWTGSHVAARETAAEDAHELTPVCPASALSSQGWYVMTGYSEL